MPPGRGISVRDKRMLRFFIIIFVAAGCIICGLQVAEAGEMAVVRIDSIAVAGTGPVTPEECLGVLLSSPGGVLNEGLLDHDRTALEALFRERGWWRAEVVAGIDSLPGGALVTFTVEKGAPAILGRFRTEGPEPVSSWIPPLPSPGKQFGSGMVSEIAREISRRSAADGYPDAVIRPAFSARGDTVEVTMTIEPGTQAVIDSFAVTGLTRTREETVLRHLAQLRGQPADRGISGRARAIIGTLGFVTVTADPQVIYPPGKPATLAILLDEGPQGTFDGVLGYQPDALGGGELIGAVDLSFRNLMGTGRAASVHWENLGRGDEHLTVSYREPWLFNRPYSLESSFSQEQRGILGFTRTALQISLNRSFGAVEAGGGYRYEKISADSLSSSSAHGIDLSFRWTALDNPLNPRRGFQYRIAWRNLARSYRFGAVRSHAIEQAEFDMDHFIPAFSNQALAVMIRYRRVTAPSSRLTAADRYWLGGANSIRGYREQSFPAVEAAWANLEYRLLQSGQSRVFVFFDYGYLIDREQTGGVMRKMVLTRTGWGFGLRTAARVGLVGFDYALGRGDSWADGKLHVSLSNSF